ncbi:hypothetical protein TNCT_241951 [Trichonephila clavata]|uniref:Uncharacterized protein n=1 Tax=Trichonephila clavata TaxID=2740835 RepID=A0A8X6LGM0_TRICU|nr:hypothetical protein TNCT_241951 [Trichonephila clavata]
MTKTKFPSIVLLKDKTIFHFTFKYHKLQGCSRFPPRFRRAEGKKRITRSNLIGAIHVAKYQKSNPFTLPGTNPIPPRIYSSESKVGRRELATRRLGQLRESMPSQDLSGSIPSVFRTIWRPISSLQEPPLLPFIQNKFLSEEFAQQMSWLG